VQKLNVPLYVGEFGGSSTGMTPEGIWQSTLVAFMKANGISYTYWSWNPDSGDTGGILQNDWKTVNQNRVDLLSSYEWPLLGKPVAVANSHVGDARAISNAYQWPK
jgi:endoglucanase